MTVDFGDTRMPARFWAKVSPSESGCWVWQAARRKDGYGSVGMGGGKTALAHRLAYLMLVGQIPYDLEIDHLCRNRSCVNPAHLEAVSKRTNILRGEGGAAQNARKTHCKNGHELVDGNVYLNGNRRVCKLCRREVDIARRGDAKRRESTRVRARNAYRARHGIPLDAPVSESHSRRKPRAAA